MKMSDKVYWKDIKSHDRIRVVGTTYKANGKTVFWGGQEALQAQHFLNTRAKGSHSRKGKLRRKR